ncbi:MAG TPA: hypothetical protein VMU09_06045 [Acidimicrobiales bacterium]|nr:hypothetical protein [Acidimicrobiales bacterium]
MIGGIGSTNVTARCPVRDCHRPIRSWRLWRRQPAQRAADVDAFFPVLSRAAALVPADEWDRVDLAQFAAWGEWTRRTLHDWAHGDRIPSSRLPSEAALVAWCAKAQGLWEALVELDPVWAAQYAHSAPALALPTPACDHFPYDIAV